MPRRSILADVAVVDGRVAAIGPELEGQAAEVVEASGLHLFPGFIDAHVHFNEPGREHWEGLLSGSLSLAAGGGTAFFEMPLNAAPPTLDGEGFARKRACAEAKSVLDFALWGGLTPINLSTMEELADAGAIGFKAFMSRCGTPDFPHSDAKVLRRGMKTAAARGLPVAVHAEDDLMTYTLAEERRSQGKVGWRDYLESRPVEAELCAIRVALELAGETSCDLHIVHVSCPEGIDLIRAARDRGVRVTAETCPHYLLLTDESVGQIGASAKCAPPLRDRSATRRNVEANSAWCDRYARLGSFARPAGNENIRRLFLSLGWHRRLPACVPFGFGRMECPVGLGGFSAICGSDRYQCRRSLWHWTDKRADRRGVGCRSGVSRSPGVWNDHRGTIVLPSRGQPIYRLGIARRYQGNLGTRSRCLSKRKIPGSGARPTTYTGS